MPISVVCTGCKKRFTVSEKFAGQKGPCPACKTVIQIPTKEEDVVIHGPDEAVTADGKPGPAAVKPILREETRFNPKLAIGIGISVLVLFIAAWAIGGSYKPPRAGEPHPVPMFWSALAAVLLGPPLSLAGYSFLRNDEFEPYRGQELWIRAAACGVVYAILWAVFAFLPGWLGMKKFEIFQLMFAVPPFVAAGAFAAYVSFELELTMCALHYALYLLVTVLLRVTAGMNPF